MTTIHNVTITLLTSFLLSFPCWAEDQQAAAADPVATAAPVASPEAAPAEAAPVAAEVDTTAMLKDDHPEQYKVVKGDTLWDIASRFLKNPWMWPEVWHVNPQIANPHLIYPGDTIKLIYLEGQARLTVKRGEAGMTYKMSPDTGATGEDAASQVAGSASTATATQSSAGDANAVSGDQKLRPAVRVMPLQEPIPAIPLDIIDPFLTSTRVVDPGVLDAAPYVVQGAQRHVITGAGAELYVRGKLSSKHSTYGVFRKGKVYLDPVTNEVLGVQAIDIGTGKVKAQDQEISRLGVIRSTQEVRIGDRLLVNQERRVESTFFPSAPESNIEASIIDVEGGVTQVGAMNVVAINKGERDQLQAGNVLAIFQRGEVVRDTIANQQVRLMDERAGLAMVFVTFEKMSYALVLYADRPLHVGDAARKP